MKKKMLVICTSVAMLHLVVAGGVMLGGCTSVEEDEPMPEGAFVPSTPAKTEVQDELQPETTLENVAPVTAGPETVIKDEPAPASVTPAPATTPKADRSSDITYTVKNGDSYWKIAQAYGVKVDELIAYNNIDPKKLRPGQKIQIPASGKKITVPKTTAKKAAVSAKAAPKAKTPIPADGIYTVQKGDSFYKIAHKFGVKADAIAAANNLSLTQPLQVNQKLKIPAPGTTADAPAAKTEAVPAVPADPAAPAVVAEVPVILEVPVVEGEVPVLPEIPADAPVAPALPEVEPAAPVPPAAAAPAADEIESKLVTTISTDSTFEDIAAQYGTSASKLREANPSLDPNAVIKAGTKINILMD